MRINKKRGFTLVELLVVMAIIALLAGLVLPGLRRAQERAKQAVCANNLRQIGQAFLMYASDNDSLLPGWFVGSAGDKDWRGGSPAPYIGKCWHSILINTGYIKDVDILICPKDDFTQNPIRCRNFTDQPPVINGVQKISYCAIPNSTSAKIGKANYNPIGYADDSKLVLLWEENRCFTDDAATGLGKINTPDGPQTRHLGSFNILWLSGNVTTYTQEDFSGTKWKETRFTRVFQ